MSTGGLASPEKYEELILALQKFNTDILQAAENMSKCGKLCKETMGSDDISKNAVERLEKAVSAYRNVTLKSTELQKKLAREREYIIKLIQESQMEGE